MRLDASHYSNKSNRIVLNCNGNHIYHILAFKGNKEMYTFYTVFLNKQQTDSEKVRVRVKQIERMQEEAFG